VLHRQPGPLDLRALLALYRFIRKNRIEIIHSHNPCAFYAGVAGRLAGVPTLIHTDHGREVPDKQSTVWEDWVASFFFDSFVAVSKELTEYLATHLKIARTRLRTIVNGVDNIQFSPRTKSERADLRAQHGLSPDDRIIGTVCRFDAIKNLPFLIACMPLILERLPRAKLIIVGEGDCRLELEQRVAELGLRGQVLLWPRRHDIENVMPIFDLYACSSLSEGTSMTILEAMACGVPIIASAVGGNRSLVVDGHGVLFSLNDRQGFIDNVVTLLDDVERLERMGHQGRLRAEQVYHVSRMAEDYQRLYEQNAAVTKDRILITGLTSLD
jgi:glycosyltransferase involved in cell wall biosynthesis